MRRLLRTAGTLVWLLAASAGFGGLPAHADFEAGMQAYHEKNYKLALENWLPAAQSGDPHAQHMLGFLFAHGRGVAKDLKQTVEWWQRAAKQGHLPAQFTLGNLFLNGLGVKRDTKRAAKWIASAADGGFADAQYIYGLMHAKGEGVARNVEMAMMYLNLAARKKGVAPSAYWTAILPYLTIQERQETRKLLEDWQPKQKNK
jgi:TPR repeat protein